MHRARVAAFAHVLLCPLAMAQNVPPPPERTAEAVQARAMAELEALRERVGVEPRQILLLGTFHFDDAGLDEYKPTHTFNALSQQRQMEIDEVLTRLDTFDATVVCVERRPESQEQLDEQFAAFTARTLPLPASEVYQLGFQLARLEGLPGVAAVDASARWLEPREDIAAWAATHDQQERLTTPYARAAYAFAQQKDRQIDAWPLLDTLLMTNSEPRLNISHGSYLIGPFAVGDGQTHPGTDGFVTAWHNRNLRIFQNIINATSPGDRVVLIIGAGHVPLLRQMAIASPDFELVEVAEVLCD